jgi:hypothetical protein
VGEQKTREIAQGEVATLESEMEVVCRDLALEKRRVESSRERFLQWYVECIIFCLYIECFVLFVF